MRSKTCWYAGCHRNTAAVCSVHTCRFKCFFKHFLFFLRHYGFLFPATARSHDVKTTKKKKKTSHFHNVTFENADAAVMSTRWGPTRALIIYCLLEQKVKVYLRVILTVQPVLMWLNLKLFPEPVYKAVSETNFSQLLMWTRPSRLILFTVKTIATQTFTVSYKKI